MTIRYEGNKLPKAYTVSAHLNHHPVFAETKAWKSTVRPYLPNSQVKGISIEGSLSILNVSSTLPPTKGEMK